jgi:hypothetical protein
MKDLLRSTLQQQVLHLLKLHAEEDAYQEFVNYLDSQPLIKDLFTIEELEEIFVKPKSIHSDIEYDVNEEGDITTSSEFTDFDSYSLQDFKEFGWLSDSTFRDKILNNVFYKNIVLPSIGDMPLDVKNEIETHSLHILGRCNNPDNWGDNRQGLVYGMVQSGKTASMMTLIGQAKSSGYRIFIILSGDKESLRNQTQKRINEAFNLNMNGWSKNSIHKIKSITELRSDYSEVAKNTSNGLDLWPLSDKEQTIIVCVKKQKDNLSKLLTHLKEIESQCNPTGRAHNYNFGTDFKTLILDDEADFASQDTSTGSGTTIHNLLCELRTVLKQNCYVAYTATPQACIGANPAKLIGYPKDFIWLLDPHRLKNGETSTYLGLEEFFVKFPNQLIEKLSDDAWPHIKKEDGVRLGIYKPGESELLVVGEKLTQAEAEHVTKLISNKKDRDSFCVDFKTAIVDYLIGCSIRWHRHYIKCKKDGYFTAKKPSTKQIEEIEAPGSKHTIGGHKPFPYHAMMFNLAYINESQGSIINLIDLLWDEVKLEWQETQKNKWKTETIFTNAFEKQAVKSMRFDSTIPSAQDLEDFIVSAITISEKLIDSRDKYIYLLNSKDEGSVLQYDSSSQDIRPKKASIIVGGNILSRGLTIENLSVTVFARSQVMSLGDTNLQMCRWFGHKKKDIDILTVYMQGHSLELFQSISEADRELRSQFKYHIYNNIPNKCLLLALFNSPLFRTTSPNKMRNSSRAEQSYSGISVDLLQHTLHPKFLENNEILDNYLEDLKKKITGIPAFNRATVYENVPADEFIDFLKKLNFSDDALNISPSKYIEYVEKWNELAHFPVPKFNVAIFDLNENGNLRKRARKIHGNSGDFISEVEFKKAASRSLAPFRGGKSDKNSSVKYCGDHLVDFSEKYHEDKYDKNNLRREKGHPILFMFYKIHPNYVGKFAPPGGGVKKEVFFVKGDDLYTDVREDFPLITFSVATPLGGLVFETRINNAVEEIVRANTVECEKFIEELNN